MATRDPLGGRTLTTEESRRALLPIPVRQLRARLGWEKDPEERKRLEVKIARLEQELS